MLVHRRSTPTSRRWTTSTAARPCSTRPTTTGYQRAYGGADRWRHRHEPPAADHPGRREVRPVPVGRTTHGDLDKAKDALTACGQPNGFATDISYRAERPKEKATAEALQQSLAKVGIKLDAQALPAGDYFEAVRRQARLRQGEQARPDHLRLGRRLARRLRLPAQIVDSRVIRATAATPTCRRHDPAVDELLDKARHDDRPRPRARRLWAQIDRKVMEDAHPAGHLGQGPALPAAERCTNVFITDGLQHVRLPDHGRAVTATAIPEAGEGSGRPAPVTGGRAGRAGRRARIHRPPADRRGRPAARRQRGHVRDLLPGAAAGRRDAGRPGVPLRRPDRGRGDDRATRGAARLHRPDRTCSTAGSSRASSSARTTTPARPSSTARRPASATPSSPEPGAARPARPAAGDAVAGGRGRRPLAGRRRAIGVLSALRRGASSTGRRWAWRWPACRCRSSSPACCRWRSSATGSGSTAPGGSYTPFIEDNPLQWAYDLILPWITLAFLYAAAYARLTRAGMLETMGEDYIRTARAKGLPERTVVVKHGLRAALTPILTIFGLDLGPAARRRGPHREHVLAAGHRQVLPSTRSSATTCPRCSGVVLVGAFFIVIANLVVDLLYAVVDPRVRLDDRTDAARRPTPAAAFLEVRDLRVHFPTDDGWSRPWTGCRSAWSAARPSASSASPAPARA